MKSSLLTYILKGSLRAVKAFFTAEPEIDSPSENFSIPQTNRPSDNIQVKIGNREERSSLTPEKQDQKSADPADSEKPPELGEKRILLNNKNDIRQAILLSEILHRPEERWEEEKKEKL